MSQVERKGMVEAGGGHDLSIDLKPFINFLVVLIPVLMLSAEFAKISIINLKLPEGRGSQTQSTVTNRPLDDESDKLLLTMIITDSVVTLGAKNGFLPTIFYKEFHKYVSREDRTNEVTVAMDPKNPRGTVANPKTGKPFDLNERQEILLYVTDETYTVLKGYYTKQNELLTDNNGRLLAQINVGDTVYTVTNPRREIIVQNPAEYALTPISAYDELKNRLMKVKERYMDARDANDIILAAENQVSYDKIIQLMDCARSADFPNISIAKLRG